MTAAWTETEKEAIGLYAILARDAMDFIEMVQESKPEVVRTLHLMLATPQKEATEDSIHLNNLGARLVFDVARKRKIPLDNVSEDKLICDRCGVTDGVKLEDSGTCYGRVAEPAFKRLGRDDPFEAPDPNAAIPLCRTCAEQHHEFWDAQWASISHY